MAWPGSSLEERHAVKSTHDLTLVAPYHQLDRGAALTCRVCLCFLCQPDPAKQGVEESGSTCGPYRPGVMRVVLAPPAAFSAPPCPIIPFPLHIASSSNPIPSLLLPLLQPSIQTPLAVTIKKYNHTLPHSLAYCNSERTFSLGRATTYPLPFHSYL